MPTQAEMQAAAEQILADKQTFHDIVHGDVADPDVSTDNGPVPPVAKMIAQLEDEFNDSLANPVSYASQTGKSEANRTDARENLQLFPMIFGNPGNLLALRRCFHRHFNFASTVAPVCLLATGDSISHTGGPVRWIADALMGKFGVGALASTMLTNTNCEEAYFDGPLSTPTFTGGAAIVSSNFTYLPNGEYISIPSAGTCTEALRSKRILTGWTKVRCFFAVKTAAGSIEFVLKINGSTIATKTVNTAPAAANTGVTPTANGADGSINYFDFLAVDGLTLCGEISLVATGSTATSIYLGSVIFREKGVFSLSMGKGNSTYADTAIQADANWTKFATAVSGVAFFHAQKGESEATIEAFLTRMKTNFPTYTHICIGNAPIITDVSPTEKEQRNFWRVAAKSRDFFFWNLNDYWMNWQWVDTLGYDTDTTHMDAEAHYLMAEDFLDNVLVKQPIAISGTGGGVLSRRSQGSLLTLEEANYRDVIQDTWRTFPLTSDQSTNAVTGVTPTINKGRFFLAVGTGCVANTVGSIEISPQDSFGGNDECAWKFGICESFVNNSGTFTSNACVRLVLRRAGSSGSNWCPVTLDTGGITWEFGSDGNSGAPLPWIRFEFREQAGNYQQSPKFYLPVGSLYFNNAGGYSAHHHFVITYTGNASLTKELKCWVCPNLIADSNAQAQKPILFAQWRPTTSDSAVWSGVSNIMSFCAGSRTASPATAWSAELIYISKNYHIGDVIRFMR